MTVATGSSAWHRLVGNGPWGRAGSFGLLDVGSSKLCCYIVKPARGLRLLGRGYQLAEGLRAGDIVDAEAAETSVLAVLLALHAGFTVLFVLAAGCYVPALLLFPTPSAPPPPAS